jgi:hypothetical protein
MKTKDKTLILSWFCFKLFTYLINYFLYFTSICLAKKILRVLFIDTYLIKRNK